MVFMRDGHYDAVFDCEDDVNYTIISYLVCLYLLICSFDRCMLVDYIGIAVTVYFVFLFLCFFHFFMLSFEMLLLELDSK